jgi:uncharacterized cupredoxin-like copper-binding protein
MHSSTAALLQMGLLALFGCSAQAALDDPGDAECTASVSLQDFKLVPDQVASSRGVITLCAQNDGRTPHDLGIRDAAGEEQGRTAVLAPGESARLTLDLDTGSFRMFCSVAGHESLGMRGTLDVE